jgi:ribosomal protein L24E
MLKECDCEMYTGKATQKQTGILFINENGTVYLYIMHKMP